MFLGGVLSERLPGPTMGKMGVFYLYALSVCCMCALTFLPESLLTEIAGD